jgi:putative ABC transport system ATP-binding protein
VFHLNDVTLVKSVKDRNFSILTNVGCEIQPQKITALIGPSGAGKSSLIRLLNRLDDPTGGKIYFRDKPLNSYNVLELRRLVGMVFQIPVMFPGTVGENIQYAAKFQPRPDKRASKSTRELLAMVGLDSDLEQRPAEQLSVGQQQRVSFARTLANNPEVLLLDEPTASLDPTAATEILQLTKTLQTNLGLTVVLITHILQQAKDYSDYTAYLEKGQLVECEPTNELFANPRQISTGNFLARWGMTR